MSVQSRIWVGVFALLVVGLLAVEVLLIESMSLAGGLAGLGAGIVGPLLMSLPAGRGRVPARASSWETLGTAGVPLVVYIVSASAGIALVCLFAYVASFGVFRRVLPGWMLQSAEER